VDAVRSTLRVDLRDRLDATGATMDVDSEPAGAQLDAVLDRRIDRVEGSALRIDRTEMALIARTTRWTVADGL
jgi:hypothetical protein